MTIEESLCLEKRIEELADEAIESVRGRGEAFFLANGRSGKAPKALRQLTDRELRRMTQDIRTLDLVHGSLQRSPHVVRLRDIFYQDVPLYGSQAASNAALQRVARRLGVPRDALNVQPACKDLVYGKCTIRVDRHWTFEWTPSMGPQLLPTGRHVSLEFGGSVVGIVEKDAVFSQLVPLLRNDMEVLLITGKGYPSRALQAVLRSAKVAPTCRFRLLMDWDPYGLDIARCYHGCLNGPTKCGGSPSLTAWVESIELTRSVELVGLRADHAMATKGDQLIPLSKQDVHRLEGLIGRLQAPWEADLRTQALAMQKARVKAELDILDPDDLVRLLI
jgi:meiotic recombination protein SPO11